MNVVEGVTVVAGAAALAAGGVGFLAGAGAAAGGGAFSAAVTGMAWEIDGSIKRIDGGSGAKGDQIIFGSDTKSATKLKNQMAKRSWTENTVRDTVSNPYTKRVSINKATGNPATVYYNKTGGYVIIDDVTNAIVQVSDNVNPSTLAPDPSIADLYLPDAPK